MYHTPVMPNEVIEALDPQNGKVFLDCTAGGGGHTSLMLERGARVVAIDRDAAAIAECSKRFEGNGNLRLIHGNYANVSSLVSEKFDGALIDLGVSSRQLDDGERGFSYMNDGPLDMRMDVSEPLSAYDIVNDYAERDIADILYKYAEERYSRKIARNIVAARKISPISTTFQLRDIVLSSVPHKFGGNPAKKTFQAIRIAVNGELDGLEKALLDVFETLKTGGRLAVLTFHSLEDRIVKLLFRRLCTDCVCSKTLPVCICGHVAEAKNICKRLPSESETSVNHRAKSATLRCIEKK